jgi:Tfp pilus assembly protein PilO
MKLGSVGNLNKREKRLLVVCIITALIFISFTYVVEPFVSRWSEVKKSISQKELLLEKGKRTVNRKDILANEYERVHSQVLSAGSTEEEISSFLSEIESLSGEGIRITNIKPRSIDEEEPYKLMSIELDLEAEIIPLSRFLYDLYQSPMLLELEQFDLSPKARETQILKGHMIVSRILLK